MEGLKKILQGGKDGSANLDTKAELRDEKWKEYERIRVSLEKDFSPLFRGKRRNVLNSESAVDYEYPEIKVNSQGNVYCISITLSSEYSIVTIKLQQQETEASSASARMLLLSELETIVAELERIFSDSTFKNDQAFLTNFVNGQNATKVVAL